MKKSDIDLIMTCQSCPEQYDAYLNGKQVGYLRLRHGYFRVDFPGSGDKTIYKATPKGDGIFYEDEREFYLDKAQAAILKELKKRKP